MFIDYSFLRKIFSFVGSHFSKIIMQKKITDYSQEAKLFTRLQLKRHTCPRLGNSFQLRVCQSKFSNFPSCLQGHSHPIN